jgi:hypothetical protein
MSDTFDKDAIKWFSERKHNFEKFKTFVVYNITLIVLFFSIYSLMPSESFGKLNDSAENKVVNTLYYTVSIHSTVAPGNIYAKSVWAQLFFCLQIALSFLGNFYIIFIR